MNVMGDVIFEEGGGTPWPWRSEILFRALFTLCWWRFCTTMMNPWWSCSSPTTASMANEIFHTENRKSGSESHFSYLRETLVILSAVRINRQRIDEFSFGKVTQGLLAAHIQTDLTKKGGEGKEGCRCLHISLSAEPLLTPFLLSFWKVCSRAEATSRERFPRRCEHRSSLQPLHSSLLRQLIKGRCEAQRGPQFKKKKM